MNPHLSKVMWNRYYKLDINKKYVICNDFYVEFPEWLLQSVGFVNVSLPFKRGFNRRIKTAADELRRVLRAANNSLEMLRSISRGPVAVDRSSRLSSIQMRDFPVLNQLFKLTVQTAFFIAGYGGLLGNKRVNRLWKQLVLLIVGTLATVRTRREMLLVARDFARNVLKALVWRTAEGDRFPLEGVERFRRYLLDLQEFLDWEENSPRSLIPHSFCDRLAIVRSTRWLPLRIDGQIPEHFPQQHDEFAHRYVDNPYGTVG